MWLGGVLFGLRMLGLGSFLMPNGENGCVAAGYLCSLSILSVLI